MFCKYCGKEIDARARFCPFCGAKSAAGVPELPAEGYPEKKSTLKTVAFVFMIISTILEAFALIPLAWMLPMTISYKNKIDRGEPVSLAFKICTLIFVSTIAGILMLCDDDMS